MTRPCLTVITPNLNRAAYLESTICSVLDQTGLDSGEGLIEYMVVDGGSSDGSIEMIERYADELTWWRSGGDTGPAEAINRAVARAAGEVIAILPAGDLWLPDALAQVRGCFEQNPDLNWLVGHCLRIGPRDDERGRIEAAPPRSFAGFLMHDSGVLPQSATFYRRRLLQRHGVFDANLRYAFGYEMACRLMAAGERATPMPRLLTAQRERDAMRGIDQTLRCGREHVDAAMRYADHLPLNQRYALWRNCDQRQRIYALAEAETEAGAAPRLLWQRLLRHPWWLANTGYRHALLHERGATEAPAPSLPAA